MMLNRVMAGLLLLGTAATALPQTITGTASWYGPGFEGRRMSNGRRFRSGALTLASRSLPFGTRVRVTNLRTRRSVVGTVTDRGPRYRSRIVDLSAGMARAIAMRDLERVRVTVLR